MAWRTTRRFRTRRNVLISTQVIAVFYSGPRGGVQRREELSPACAGFEEDRFDDQVARLRAVLCGNQPVC
jgi:hypothetical protein